jgi:hypothetical protein
MVTPGRVARSAEVDLCTGSDVFLGLCGIITFRDHQPPKKKHMLNELEFAYTPVRDKVRDLREYL